MHNTRSRKLVIDSKAGTSTLTRKPSSDLYSALTPVDDLLMISTRTMTASWLRDLKPDVKIDDELREDVLQAAFIATYRDPGWKEVLNTEPQSEEKRRALIAHGGEFVKMLDECIIHQQWQRLMESPALRKAVPTTPTGFPKSQAKAVEAAFESEYLGTAHLVMLKAVDEIMEDPKTAPKIYARFLSVVQSSGMGKSKTIHKISQDRIVISMCLREDDSPETFSYPPSDHMVRDYLLRAEAKIPEDCKSHIRGFLACLFAEFAAKIKGWSSSGNLSHAQIVTLTFELFNRLGDSRHEFYESVVKAASVKPIDKKNQPRPWLSSDLLNAMALLEQTVDHALRGESDWSCIIMAVDEVHVLYAGNRNEDLGHTIYSLFKSVMSELVSRKLCTIALTTTSSISKLAPSKRVAPSEREATPHYELLIPLTEFPFDVHLYKHPLVAGEETLKSAGSLESTVRFGRPLWKSVYDQRHVEDPSPFVSTKPEEIHTDAIMKVVVRKLSGHDALNNPPQKLDASSIAILSARLLLKLSPLSSQAFEYQQDLVRNHMRVVYSVNKDRVTIFTGSSTEPLLAEAAARIMHHKVDGKPYMDVWDLLLQYVQVGLAGQGPIGELIGRTLSIQAMDHAIINLPNGRLAELQYQTPVLVTEYFKALLTNDAWKNLQTSVPANRSKLTKAWANKTFEKAFEGAYFHFSHYAEAADSRCLNRNHLWPLWLRGTALLCRPNQELTDRVAPIFFSHLNTLSPYSISAMLQQDKTSATTDAIYVGIQSAEQLNLFSGSTDLPYIAVVHCYAAAEQNSSARTTRSDRYNLKSKKENKESPRYQLNLHGLSDYALLDDHLRGRILDIINHSQSFLVIQHKRKYGVNDMLGMKPFITAEMPASGWYDNNGMGE